MMFGKVGAKRMNKEGESAEDEENIKTMKKLNEGNIESKEKGKEGWKIKRRKKERKGEDGNKIKGKVKEGVSGEKVYKKIKFKGEIYSLGDEILIKENDNSNMVGVLKRVIAQGGSVDHPTWPMIEVQW